MDGEYLHTIRERRRKGGVSLRTAPSISTVTIIAQLKFFYRARGLHILQERVEGGKGEPSGSGPPIVIWPGEGGY